MRNPAPSINPLRPPRSALAAGYTPVAMRALRYILLLLGGLGGLLSLLAPHVTAACATEADCSYFGRCVAGRCICRHQYNGTKCEAFAFAPLDLKHGTGLRTVNTSTGQQTSSWGGSVLLDENGTYHMFAAEMINSVGIKSWRSNSRVVHATTARRVMAEAGGVGEWAFTRRDVAQPVFAHEPTVSRAPTGEWVMFFTTNAGEAPGSQCSLPLTCGNNGSSCLSDLNAQQCPCKQTHCAPLSTRMSYAEQPGGPWSQPVLVPSKGSGDTNLACIIRANSSLVCLGRPSLGVMRADHWCVWNDDGRCGWRCWGMLGRPLIVGSLHAICYMPGETPPATPGTRFREPRCPGKILCFGLIRQRRMARRCCTLCCTAVGGATRSAITTGMYVLYTASPRLFEISVMDSVRCGAGAWMGAGIGAGLVGRCTATSWK